MFATSGNFAMGRLGAALEKIRHYGMPYYLRQTMRRSPYPALSHGRYVKCVEGMKGLEIGGPSPVFRKDGLIPLYDFVGQLDNCNYGENTVWEGHLTGGRTFKYYDNKPPGVQYLCEGGDLSEISDGGYDFILSSHMLEHSANPLKILKSWHRLLRRGGTLILLLPDKNWTFDHKRPVTTLEHLI